jgi:hypothetical protein
MRPKLEVGADGEAAVASWTACWRWLTSDWMAIIESWLPWLMLVASDAPLLRR